MKKLILFLFLFFFSYTCFAQKYYFDYILSIKSQGTTAKPEIFKYQIGVSSANVRNTVRYLHKNVVNIYDDENNKNIVLKVEDSLNADDNAKSLLGNYAFSGVDEHYYSAKNLGNNQYLIQSYNNQRKKGSNFDVTYYLVSA
ncbi:hypothetical protein [Frigoriflavimonas asaccharolytica]|uniref:Uncharacterized protein n=1 Tax=Frigoriflavimonas asaccharolytica TaxID=2735899 RepID=A0A8J8GCR5_9FLAO|nr:hypothetical protein [Frigoriflavimonas asaccharolytica]NRS94122.1 hypothetical protein [Frigoriflavimonas asaccharolytica]